MRRVKVHLFGSHNKVMKTILKLPDEPKNGSIFMVIVVTDDSGSKIVNPDGSPIKEDDCIATSVFKGYKKGVKPFGVDRTLHQELSIINNSYRSSHIDVLLWLRHGKSAHNGTFGDHRL